VSSICSTCRRGGRSVFWHPKGWRLYRVIEEYMRRRLDAAGYLEVRGPTLLDRSLWEASGHWETFRENMFIAESRRRAHPRGKADELARARTDLPHRLRKLPRIAVAAGRIRQLPPQRAVWRLARADARCAGSSRTMHTLLHRGQVTAEAIGCCKLLLSIYRDFWL